MIERAIITITTTTITTTITIDWNTEQASNGWK
jgi:hypothetical protein